jgi:hypothetical protein
MVPTVTMLALSRQAILARSKKQFDGKHLPIKRYEPDQIVPSWKLYWHIFFRYLTVHHLIYKLVFGDFVSNGEAGEPQLELSMLNRRSEL